MEKHHLRMNYVCFDDPKLGALKTSNKMACCTPTKLGQSLWITFVSKGAHVVGLREKHWVACEIGLPYFPSDFPDCSAYSFFIATEAAASDKKSDQRPPALRPFRVPVPPPWDGVRVALDKVCMGMQDTQVSIQKNVINDKLCGKSDVTLSGYHDSSFDIIVARTSITLTSFLNDIHGDQLLLFPQVSNGNRSILRFMKDERMLRQGHGGIGQINYDRKLCFLRVFLPAYKEGVFDDVAIVCAPSLTDISLWTSSSGSTEGVLTIPQSSVRSYFKEQSSGEWELQIPEDPAFRESH